MASAATEATKVTSMMRPVAVSGRLACQSRLKWMRMMFMSFSQTNGSMLSLSTYPTGQCRRCQHPSRRLVEMAKKRAYHHGDLERALVDGAVKMIQNEGVQALTLRGVGALLGVSRTALYRHFAHKEALLARVAAEGFKRFHEALASAVARAGKRHQDPLPAMAAAYISFARSNPSHYQTMFSGVLTDWRQYPDLMLHAEAAFNVLRDAIRAQQKAGR